MQTESGTGSSGPTSYPSIGDTVPHPASVSQPHTQWNRPPLSEPCGPWREKIHLQIQVEMSEFKP